MLEKFLYELESILGSKKIYREYRKRYAYARDYWPYMLYKEYMYRGIKYPYAVIAPESEEEVIQILNLASEYKVKIIPYGGGSGVLGGIYIDDDTVVLDLGRLNWIRWYDEYSRIIEVGPGVIQLELEEWLRKRGYTTRHYPQSLPNATIGGLISTRSIGQYSTGYGGIENLIKGIHIAIPNLGIVRIRPQPRRSVLIPIEKMFIGSEGMYGVVTDAYLEVFREPKFKQAFTKVTDSFKEAIKYAYKLVDARIYPELLRIFDEYETIFHFPGAGWGSIMIGCIEGYYRDYIDSKMSLVERILDGLDDEEYFWRWFETRNDVIKWIYELYKNGYGFETIEVSARWSGILDIYHAVREETLKLDGVDGASAHIGHFYNTGVGLYFTFIIRIENYTDIYFKLWDKVMKIVYKYGGGISHHHGVGYVRMNYIKLEYGEEGLKLLKMLKNMLDPNKVFRGFI